MSDERHRLWPYKRCEGVTAAGVQCKCYATQRVNEIPYCDQHARKELNVADAYAQGRAAVAMPESTPLGRKRD